MKLSEPNLNKLNKISQLAKKNNLQEQPDQKILYEIDKLIYEFYDLSDDEIEEIELDK